MTMRSAGAWRRAPTTDTEASVSRPASATNRMDIKWFLLFTRARSLVAQALGSATVASVVDRLRIGGRRSRAGQEDGIEEHLECGPRLASMLHTKAEHDDASAAHRDVKRGQAAAKP